MYNSLRDQVSPEDVDVPSQELKCGVEQCPLGTKVWKDVFKLEKHM